MQRWIWERKWTELHPIQEAAIPPLLAGDTDLIVAAPTAGGKTEAAFMPIASAIADPEGPGIACLSVSPLKALINDQHQRLEALLKHVGVPAHRWHGDVPSSAKKRLLKDPSGLLLITPESLEALFVIHGAKLASVFATLRYVVVDELHAFMGRERGRQLQSLLHRVELVVGRRLARVGLSATLGDFGAAREFLRPGGGAAVQVIRDDAETQALKIQLRGVLCRDPMGPEADQDALTGLHDIADHIYDVLRGEDNLVFANSRRRVEELADLLRRRAEHERVPNEFLPHHGSLSKELRHDAESIVRDETRPGSAVCTSTLELGIDIGSVHSVAQVGCPHGVASLRQRLGRSGRRGDDPAILRLYVMENEVTPKTAVQDRLRVELVQCTAMVELLLEGWFEPPLGTALHASTLVQQLLSLVAQHGGVTAKRAFQVLCDAGPFDGFSPELFGEFLRGLGETDLISQTKRGELVFGLKGERIVDHYTFFAAFSSPEEYRLLHDGRVLGGLPILYPIVVGMCIVFGGQRWRVQAVDHAGRAIDVKPTPGGRPPDFGGDIGSVHRKVRQRMRQVYESSEVPRYLDAGAVALLEEARADYARLGLAADPIVAESGDCALFPWFGDREQHTLALMLRHRGADAVAEHVSVVVSNTSPDEVRATLRALVNDEPPAATDLVKNVENKIGEKHDEFLADTVLDLNYASRALDVPGALEAATWLLSTGQP